MSAPATAALGKPFWDQTDEKEVVEQIRAKIRKHPNPDHCAVFGNGTVVAIVDGIVYYNTPSHRADDLGI